MDENQLPDARRPLNELGFDSLTGVEFANRVQRAIGHHLNPTLLFDYPTLESLAGYIVRELLHLEAGPAAPPASGAAGGETPVGEADREQSLDEVEGMSEEEINALVEQQLSRLQTGGEGQPDLAGVASPSGEAEVAGPGGEAEVPGLQP